MVVHGLSRPSLRNTPVALIGRSRRWLASKATRDQRLAGRRRFYRETGVADSQAPWLAGGDTAVASPISAGVDGTDSASGVAHLKQQAEANVAIDQFLVPRSPGSTDLVDGGGLAWYGVTLDQRPIRTPLGLPLAVPSNLLATMLAAEWDNQSPVLVPAQMPLMTLSCTAIDQVASQPDFYREQVLRYLATDTVCFWADPTEDRGLYQRQQQAWEALHEWVERWSCGHKAATALGTMEGVILSRRGGLGHPPGLVQFCQDWVESLDAWHLAALHAACAETKSFLTSAALLVASLTPEQALEACRAEEEYQINNWGLVEGQHDYDRLNGSIQLHAVVLLRETLALDNGW